MIKAAVFMNGKSIENPYKEPPDQLLFAIDTENREVDITINKGCVKVVIDGPQSAVWDQAENRLHTQKALLVSLLGI